MLGNNGKQKLPWVLIPSSDKEMLKRFLSSSLLYLPTLMLLGTTGAQRNKNRLKIEKMCRFIYKWQAVLNLGFIPRLKSLRACYLYREPLMLGFTLLEKNYKGGLYE